jgi:hypothetical protein
MVKQLEVSTLVFEIDKRDSFPCLYLLVILFLLFSNRIEAQQLKLLGVSAGSHVNSSAGSVKLSGTIGSPIGHSGTSLKGGFIAAASGLLIENVPPHILVTAISTFTLGTPPVITATVTDPVDGIQYVALRVRPIGGTAFDSLNMTPGTNNTYSVTLSSNQSYDLMGFEYYVTASDNTGKRRKEPALANNYTYTKDPNAAIPSTRIQFGKRTEDYRIITVPYQIGQNSVTSLFSVLNELGEYDKTKWRIFSHEGGTVFKEFPDFNTLQPGRGYWLLINDQNPVSLGFADAPVIQNNQSNLFEITLKPQWNLIGNPYTLAIDWSDVQDYNTDVQVDDLKTFNGTYINSDVLQPFEGGFVFLNGTTNKTVRIPFKGQVNAGGRKERPLSSDISAENWRLDFELHQGNRQYTLGGIGMHTDALVEKDRYDDHNPPRFQSFLEMNFAHAEHALGSFCRDVVPTQDQYKWTFTVDASDSNPIVLRWDNLSIGNNGIGLYLYEPGSASLINMHHVNSHPVTQRSPIQIYYGRQPEDISPEVAVAGKVFPNPFNRSASDAIVFPFALPASAHEYFVQIEVLDARGMRVKNVLHEKLAPGFYEAKWEGTDENSKSCAAGIYVYRVTLSQPGNVKTITEKLIITN